MHSIDWIILISTLLFIVGYGTWRTRGSQSTRDFIKGGNAKWWTIGLSVMATQASAITFLSTPGQAYHDGMGFVQFYFGLPLAMIIICMVFIPLYHKLKVYTAYEFLEERFNLKTRTLAACLFLVQRGLAAGITIFAPSIILSTILGWDLWLLNFIIGILVIIYTVSGGTKAVNVTQKQQMAVIMGGMIITFFVILSMLPEGIGFSNALEVAGANDRMEVVNFDLDFDNRYTFWSGITGGLFLALSYFGTDQSQVQRYLSGKNVRESQLGLIFNGLLKIPMQFFILLVGIMVFVFFQFNTSPLNFNPSAEKAVLESEYADEYVELQEEHESLRSTKESMMIAYIENDYVEKEEGQIRKYEKLQRENREKAQELILKADPSQEVNDKDYVFIHFILNYLPMGLIGLLIAVIISAAMSSNASELNALASITAIDLYKRYKDKDDKAVLKMTKWFTIMWGLIAIAFACFGTLFENLIQFVNIIGSIFYGNILGIFLLAFFMKFIRGNAVFIAAIITQLTVIGIYVFLIVLPEKEYITYLWLNAIGCGLVVLIAIILHYALPNKKSPEQLSQA